MDFTQLRAFVTVAHEGNLTRAAETLHVTQPAVSLQIKLLQERLNLTLFTRTSAGMKLTNEGSKLLPVTRVMAGAAAILLRKWRRVFLFAGCAEQFIFSFNWNSIFSERGRPG